MEESLRNGVVLAKLAKFVTPDVKFRVFDEELNYFNEHGLNFRHTDNINAFRRSLEKIKEIFDTFNSHSTRNLYLGQMVVKIEKVTLNILSRNDRYI